MATGTTIIDAALHALQALQEGASHNTNQGTFALAHLNRMLEAWSIRKSFVYREKEEDLSWPGATTSRTIGTSGNFNTTRPSRIVSAAYRGSDGYDWPVPVSEERPKYEQIMNKALAGDPPELLYYDRGFPLGVLYVWPVPSASWTLRLSTWEQLSSLATVGATFSMPPGYEEALVWNLAERLWPTYPSEQTRDLVRSMALETRTAIRSYNTFPVPTLRIDPGLASVGSYNIYQDR
jgi:hypothetical protein